jgi:hypothetical protein
MPAHTTHQEVTMGHSNRYYCSPNCSGWKRTHTAERHGEKFIPFHKWVTFTRRTEDPKLSWLETQLDRTGIEHRRNGASWHAPILEVFEADLEKAWAILTPVDGIHDDDERFRLFAEGKD